MPGVELAAAAIDYEDTGGEGPTLPLGSHLKAMRPDANLSLRGQVLILAEFIDAVGLDEVTLCFSDWSCGQTMIADGLVEQVGRLVFVSCETADNYPPGLGGHAVWAAAKVPGGFQVLAAILANPRLRPLPMFFGPMTKVGIPDQLMHEWLAPWKRPEIRRDLRKYAGDAMRGKRDMRAATASLASFERPVLVVWDEEGKMMPNEEGRKLAAAFPDSRLVELPDCYTPITEDRPVELARLISDFAG